MLSKFIQYFIAGQMTIDEVPHRWREAVAAALEE